MILFDKKITKFNKFFLESDLLCVKLHPNHYPHEKSVRTGLRPSDVWI